MLPIETTNVLSVPGEITPTSLTIPEHLSFEDWMAVGAGLKNVEQSIMFWIGDWLVYGEGHYGEQWTQVTDVSQYSPKTISNAMWVAKKVPVARRREDLSYGHHVEVASLEPHEQSEWLKRAKDEELPRDKMRALIREAKGPQKITPPADPSMPKDPPQRDNALREDARHEDCIRCHAPHAVSAHYCGIGKHMLGGGASLKSHDIATAWLCDKCHKEFDGYEAGNSYERGWEFLMLILKTIVKRIERGTIVIP